MPSNPLSPEICTRIVHFLSTPPTQHTPRHLRTLCLTCKPFHASAAVKLYETLIFTDAQRAYLLCHTLQRRPALGAHVRSFCFSQAHDAGGPLVLGQAFWAAVHGALRTMTALEYLVLFDASFANSWVLDALGGGEGVGGGGGGGEEGPGEARDGCTVAETKLRFRWDEHVVRFLERQKKLAVLQVQAQEYGVSHVPEGRAVALLETPLAPGSLRSLRVFDGTLVAGLEVARVGAPVTHVQVIVERDAVDAVEGVDPCEGLEEDVRVFSRVAKTLKSLNLVDVPEEMVGRVVGVLAAVCPGLVYLGLLPLPVLQRDKFTHALMSLRLLRHIQLDISKWAPHPNTSAQRILASELKIYCPSLRHVVFWYHNTRFRWQYSQEQWHPQVDNPQHPQLDLTWSLV